ncbi:TetR/AcrR family transcriptional regulator [Clavibacter michiganensis]|uniref:TetR/AcrR family transcriptional regulator n=1 Tax=Clavibacter michiganensis TaxID=28447 RepID=UPI0009A5BDC0|nr:TetR family transcriptional regulator [Clavibacter michiganensis]MBF4639000.1 TetR family transcriptional regulator [Clavibacter michiganensis subsp. michiganensis]MDO4124788.1 TetR family transcriptional regulator [Clavibacter michiganensis]MDO4139556.1 TetR family transcriptional regulator [Clavibacter michiganensis]MWJ07541.1 TetR family transcriptional regulator [Clavibacter michiganensis subsp. michiganensis]MWJ88751.1 TetR family transcriptional regulator [Clavibacter michiganensis su
MTAPTPTRAPRRSDPHRRDRIIDACLDVIADVGVDGTTHRRVAAAADVPLGSMTYHFDGMDDLLHEAFTRFADRVAERMRHRMGGARTTEETEAAVVDVIVRDLLGTQRVLVLTHELYTLAARRPEYRTITQTWMARSRATFEERVDPVTARMLDALVEGLSIHRALDPEPPDEAFVREAVRRILGSPAAPTGRGRS